MEKKGNIFDDLIDDTSGYFKARKELIKLQATEKIAKVSAGILSFFIILPFFLFAFLFVSFSLAQLFGEWWGHVYAGYLTVTGLYTLIGLLMVRFRKSWLVQPIMNAIIKMLLSK